MYTLIDTRVPWLLYGSIRLIVHDESFQSKASRCSCSTTRSLTANPVNGDAAAEDIRQRRRRLQGRLEEHHGLSMDQTLRTIRQTHVRLPLRMHATSI